MKNKIMLYPSCSEYVARIKLTPKELKQAKKLSKKFNFDKEDQKFFEERLKEGEEGNMGTFGQFIEEEFAQPYLFIANTILEQRNKK